MKADDEWASTLELLERRRAPYAGPLATIAGDILRRFPPAGGAVLEVGAGAGQLRDWLPASLRARAMHSEPSAAAVKALHRRAPDAGAVRAPVEALPIPNGACGAVLGLCVFDAIPDARAAAAEVARVLAPGGRWVFAVNHPMRWAFSDDPGPDGLVVSQSYFDRTPYVEVDGGGTPTYVEHHRTLGDRVRDVVAAGLELVDLVEPEWPDGRARVWGQWSPLRGALFPGTAIFVCRRP